MAEVLSQSQIDALLNSMQDSGGGDQDPRSEKKKTEYRKYDFYSPKKFTKDRLKLVQGIYDNFARIVSSRLNGVLRVNSEIEVVTVEEQRYYEFSNGLSDDDVITLVDFKLPDDSKNLPMVVYINQVLMVNMIDRMIGGLGNDNDIDATYTYTDIELVLYQKVMNYILSGTSEAWKNYIKLDLKNERLEENPSLFQDISLDEPIAIVMLKAHVEDIEGMISMVIPGGLLTSIFSIIDRRKHVEGDYVSDTESTRAAILSRIKESALTVRADLGEAKVSLKDVYGLRVGDVLDLNKPKNSELSVYVEKEPWFTGKAGVHKKNVAIRIQKRMDDEEDKNEWRPEELEQVERTERPENLEAELAEELAALNVTEPAAEEAAEAESMQE